MPILVKPYLGCNLKCKYCYQHTMKERKEYDITKVTNAMTEVHTKGNQPITLHGGEPLCLGYRDVERILSHSVKLTQGSSIQTNGTLIDARFIEIFKKYKTHVGISLDGNEELNILRCDLAATDKILKNLNMLIENKIPVSVIITIHNHNTGTDEQLSKLKSFILNLNALGICGRLNLNHSEYSLSEPRSKTVFLDLAKFMLENKLVMKWGIFSDIINSLKQNGMSVCTLKNCDIYSTNAALVILGDGSQTNCLRTEILVRHPQQLTTRTEILAKVEQMDGGCKDCKFFLNCKGGCPSNAQDWRMRDKFCTVYYTLFDYYSNILGQFGIFDLPKQATLCNPQSQIQQLLSTSAGGATHSDGIEHCDGETRHLDGVPGQGQSRHTLAERNHADGIDHIDGETHHTDSDQVR